MTTRHLVDPALESFIQGPPLDITHETLPLVRQGLKDIYAGVLGPGDPEVAVAEHMAPGPDGAPDVRVYVYTPPGEATRRPVFFHIHGGGYILGDAAMMTPLSQARARTLGCVVVSVDYRLAPETHFPGSLEDNYAALRWMNENAKQLGIDTSRIAVKGESAGGGHAAMLTLAVREVRRAKRGRG